MMLHRPTKDTHVFTIHDSKAKHFFRAVFIICERPTASSTDPSMSCYRFELDLPFLKLNFGQEMGALGDRRGGIVYACKAVRR
jgi:hypothetical protein